MSVDEAIRLYRPFGAEEVSVDSPERLSILSTRLPEQPIFYSVMTEAYAVKIAHDWNVKTPGTGGSSLPTMCVK